MQEPTEESSQRISRRGLLAAAGVSVAAGGWWLLGSPTSAEEAPMGGNPWVPEDIDERAWITAHGFIPGEKTTGLGEPVTLKMQLRNSGGEDGSLRRTAYIQSVDEDGVVHRYDHTNVEVDVPAGSSVEASLTMEAPRSVDDFTAVLPEVWVSYDLMVDLTSTIKVRA